MPITRTHLRKHVHRIAMQAWHWLVAARAQAWLQSSVTGRALVSDEELLTLLHQVQAMHAVGRRHAMQPQPGEQLSPFVGRGSDFEEARSYMPGDDLRHMDWRATARTGRPYIKVYRQERQSVLHLVVDRGATMRFATRGQLKVTQAARMAMLLTLDAHLMGEAVGLTLLDSGGETLRPQSGQAAIQTVIEHLNRSAPPLDDSVDYLEAVSASLADMELQAPTGARIVLFTDGRFIKPQHLALFARLASSREVSVVQILDVAETRLPRVGLVRWLDIVNGDMHVADGSDPEQRRRFDQATREWLQTIATLLEQSGVRLHQCSTEEDAWAFVSRKLLHHE